MEDLVKKALDEALKTWGGKYKITVNVEVEVSRVRDKSTQASPDQLPEHKLSPGLIDMFEVPLPEVALYDGQSTLSESEDHGLPWKLPTWPHIEGDNTSLINERTHVTSAVFTAHHDSDRPTVKSPL